jgi:hypothetical protein
MFCATALVTAAAAPAVASDRGSDRSRDSLRVTVCKQVNNWDRGNNDNGGHRDRRFGFDASTDRDNTRFRLGDDECKRFNLRFRDNRFTLEEQNTRGYNVRFRVRGDDERTRSRDGRLWVTFNDRTFSPNLWITVINSRDRNRHNNGNNNWNQN